MTAVIIVTLAVLCAVLLWVNTDAGDDTWTDESGDRWHPSGGRKP